MTLTVNDPAVPAEITLSDGTNTTTRTVMLQVVNTSTSIESVRAVSGSKDVANVLSDKNNRFEVNTTGDDAPVTLTVTPTSTEADANFTATARIGTGNNAQTVNLTRSGSGSNTRLTLASRNYPIADTPVEITLSDGKGNQDTKTITVSVKEVERVETITANLADGTQVGTVTNTTPTVAVREDSPLTMSGKTPDTGPKTVTFTVASSTITNPNFKFRGLQVKTGTGDWTDIAASAITDNQKTFTHSVTLGTNYKFRFKGYDTAGQSGSPYVYFNYTLDHVAKPTFTSLSATSTDGWTSASNRARPSVDNLANGATFEVYSTDVGRSVTLTLVPASTNDNPQFSATARIGSSDIAFTKSGTNLVLTRDYDTRDTSVAITLRDGKGNPATRTITVSVKPMEEIESITATLPNNGGSSGAVRNPTPQADIPASNPIAITQKTESATTPVTVTFTATVQTATKTNFQFKDLRYDSGSGWTNVAATNITNNEKKFTHSIVLDAAATQFQFRGYDTSRKSYSPWVRFSYRLAQKSTSIDAVRAVSGPTEVANVLSDENNRFEVRTQGASAPVTLTVTPTSTEADANFTVTAKIGTGDDATTLSDLRPQGGGSNLIVIGPRDYTVDDTPVEITLNDGQGNQDTKTITVRVVDDSAPQITRVQGRLTSRSAEGTSVQMRTATSFDPVPTLVFGTQDTAGSKKVTVTVTGEDNLGADALKLESVTVGGTAVAAGNIRKSQRQFDVSLTVGSDAVEAVIILEDAQGNSSPAVRVNLQLKRWVTIKTLGVAGGGLDPVDDLAEGLDFQPSATGKTVDVTLTLTPDGASENAALSASAKIGAGDNAPTRDFTRGSDGKFVLTYPFAVGSNEVMVTLRDDQNNTDTRTIDINVGDGGNPVFKRVVAVLGNQTERTTRFPDVAPFPLLKIKTKDKTGNKTVTYTVEGTDNSGDDPELSAVSVNNADTAFTAGGTGGTGGTFDVTLTVNDPAVPAEITLSDGTNTTTRTVMLQVVNTSTSIESVRAVSGSKDVANVLSDKNNRFEVNTTGDDAPVTLTVTPTSTEADANFTATARIGTGNNAQTVNLTRSGSGSNTRLTLASRNYPIADTPVEITLSDGKGNQDTKTITVSVKEVERVETITANLADGTQVGTVTNTTPTVAVREDSPLTMSGKTPDTGPKTVTFTVASSTITNPNFKFRGLQVKTGTGDWTDIAASAITDNQKKVHPQRYAGHELQIPVQGI